MAKKAEENEYKKGLWTVEEDKILMDYVKHHGKGQWNRIAKNTGLKRCGKSCRLRWVNYLSPNVKKDNFTEQEEDLIIRLHKLLGNRWSLIAKRVPGRTDNQVKNYWNSHLSKKIGVKYQTKKSNGLENRSNSTETSEEKCFKNINPSKSGTNEIIIRKEKTQNEDDSIDGFLSENVQAAPVAEEGGDYVNSLLVDHHDDFELSTLTTFMDFIDGC